MHYRQSSPCESLIAEQPCATNKHCSWPYSLRAILPGDILLGGILILIYVVAVMDSISLLAIFRNETVLTCLGCRHTPTCTFGWPSPVLIHEMDPLGAGYSYQHIHRVNGVFLSLLIQRDGCPVQQFSKTMPQRLDILVTVISGIRQAEPRFNGWYESNHLWYIATVDFSDLPCGSD